MSRMKKIYLRVLVFLLIYIEFGYQMVVAAELAGWARTLVMLVASVPLIFMMRSVSQRSFVVLLYLAALIIINSVRDASLENCILLLVPIAIGFLIANSLKFSDLIEAFNDVMLFLAVYSLITFLISQIFPGLIRALPFLGYRYESTAPMHNAFFSVCMIDSETSRNYGIAWEPGAFALLLCVSLFCVLAFPTKVKKYQIFILVITILTTFSTMGYFVMAGIFLAMLTLRTKKQKISKGKIAAFAVVLAVILMLLPEESIKLVFGKLEGLFTGGEDLNYTTQTRLDAIYYPFQAFWESPLIGAGNDGFYHINKELCDGVATNTILNWFAAMGVLLGVPCAAGYFSFVLKNAKRLRLSTIGTIILVATAVLLVSTESLLRISLIYILIFYGCREDLFGEKNNENLIHPRSV